MNITVEGYQPFPCPLQWTVDAAERRIRTANSLTGGYIQRNNVATNPADLIEEGNIYVFVGGEKLQSQAEGK
jgi:hypothetical protein